MPMAAMAQDVMVTGSALRSEEALAAPAVAPTFDEVEYQTNITVVFEIISEEE